MEGFPESKIKLKSQKISSSLWRSFLKREYEVTGKIYKSGEWPEKVFLGMKWVENGRFGLKIGAIEAKWHCGPFGPVFEVKNGPPRPVLLHILRRPAVGPSAAYVRPIFVNMMLF